MVTCPLHKEAIHAAGYIDDIGHQEILARLTGATSTATVLMTPGLKVVHLSTHKSLIEAARTEMDAPLVRKLITAARQAANGDLILMPTMGGSLPLYLFNDVLGRPLVIVPVANHDNNQHAPDENLRLANLWYGIDLMASLFTMD